MLCMSLTAPGDVEALVRLLTTLTVDMESVGANRGNLGPGFRVD